MKKYVITEENLKVLDDVLQPLKYLSQPIPSDIYSKVCQALAGREELKEKAEANSESIFDQLEPDPPIRPCTLKKEKASI